MSYRKVYGGTPAGNESRCDTCARARIIQGYAESERLVFCDAAYPPVSVPFRVRQCSMYEDSRLPDFDDMKEIAWQIRSKSAGNRAGFITVPEQADLKKQEQQQEVTPEAVPVTPAAENK
jgi:hypothetical protein